MRRINVFRASVLIVFAMFSGCASLAQVAGSTWQAKLRQQLPLLGHRNWILIVDSAYPLQVSPGIEVMDTGAEQLEVTNAVLAELDRAVHVTPLIYLDAELPYVPERQFAGLNAYRESLKRALGTRPVRSLPHEQIIAKVGEAGKEFKILVLKTNMTMPYTSVFLQLDCKYWSEEDERKLRSSMQSAPSR